MKVALYTISLFAPEPPPFYLLHFPFFDKTSYTILIPV